MKKHGLPIFVIITLSLALYSNTLKNGFVYDDEFTIVNNSLIKNIDNLTLLFDKKEYFARSGEASYRPVVTFTYFIDYALYGLKSWGYHLTNILLHAINGVLLYTFLTLLLKYASSNNPARCFSLNNPPLLITLLFISHPVLTEAVNAISYREDLLVFLFYMIVLILYLTLSTNHKSSIINRLLLPISCLFYLLALLSKEMAATLPLVVYCYDRLIKGRRSILPSCYNIWYVVLVLFYFYLNFFYFGKPKEDIPNWAIWEVNERLITFPWLLIAYIKLVLFPVSLSADYEIIPVRSLLSWSFIASSFMIFSILVVFAIKQPKKEITFGAFFFVIALLPVYNLIPINNPLAERYLYLPIAGFAIIAGFLFINILSTYQHIRIFVLFLAVLSLCSATVIKRNAVWKTNYSLFSDTVKKMPNSNRAHFNLGLLYVKAEKLDKAIDEFKTVIKINPYYADAHNSLGNIYNQIGKIDDAISEYLITLKLNPMHVEAHYNLGFTYLGMGLKDKAKQELETALRLNPDMAFARKVLESLENTTAFH